MKCMQCNIDVSPGYTKALNENTCPACGGEIMSKALYQEFTTIKESLSGSEVTDSDLVKVAALISGKYRLVPRGANPGPATGQRFQHKGVSRVGDGGAELDERDADLEGLPPEVQAREKALRDAEEEKLASEWGLDKGELSASISLSSKKRTSDITQEPLSPEVAELANAIGASNLSGDDMVPALGDSSTNAFEAQRMAKLAQLKSDPNYSSVRRLDD